MNILKNKNKKMDKISKYIKIKYPNWKKKIKKL